MVTQAQLTKKKVAIVGATGAVGREMLKDLEESGLAHLCQPLLFASPRSEGESFSYCGKALTVKAWTLDRVRDCPFVLMSAGSAFSREHAPAMAAQGAIVIDNSSAWRMEAQTPLVVPEVNGHVLSKTLALLKARGGIIANPNCSTIQMVVALKPLLQHFGLKQVFVATYQSVSGSGQKGLQELGEQVEAHFKFTKRPPQVYPQPIAFNIMPHIGSFEAGQDCEEEQKIIQETRKILELPDLAVMATTARVPVFNCHSEAVMVQLGRKVRLDEVETAFAQARGLIYDGSNQQAELASPYHCTGQKEVYVCRARLRDDGQGSSDWLQFWNVADNLKKGAATNAVAILEALFTGGQCG